MQGLALRRSLVALSITTCVLAANAATAQEAAQAKRWVAGGYSFSDELGGFTITGVSGSGTKDDPIVIQEELNSASPVQLVVRLEAFAAPFNFTGDAGIGFTHYRFVVVNNSGLAWIEFEFELQELRDLPSLFGDGLSFDQRRTDGEGILSSNFAQFSRNYEPYDRLRFSEGKVDPARTVDFSFLVTDFTPRMQFYIVQDPRIPSS
jgi:hypothetical protein